MSFQYITSEQKESILHVEINRPDKMNALNTTLLAEIKIAVDEAQNNPEIYGILLRGVGDKAFAAGADIAEFQNFSSKEGENMSRAGHGVMNALENSSLPTIAAVNGFALGGGCELAMACHMRVASTNAKFGLPEVGLGLIPGYGGTQRLPQLVGKAKAFEMAMTGDMIDAQEAYRLGLVNYVVEQEELEEKCLAIFKRISKKSYSGIAKVIQAVNDNFNKEINGMETEITLFGESFSTDDFVEGTEAFIEKRRANFKRQ